MAICLGCTHRDCHLRAVEGSTELSDAVASQVIAHAQPVLVANGGLNRQSRYPR